MLKGTPEYLAAHLQSLGESVPRAGVSKLLAERRRERIEKVKQLVVSAYRSITRARPPSIETVLIEPESAS